jgi:hypothetical protein
MFLLLVLDKLDVADSQCTTKKWPKKQILALLMICCAGCLVAAGTKPRAAVARRGIVVVD